MKKFVFIRLLAGMLLLMLAVTGLAQEDLTPEQQELVDRVVAIAEAEQDFDSFVEERITVENQAIVVNIGDITQEITQTKSLETVATIILGDAPNGSATGTLSFVSNNGGQEVAYIMNVELRYVDGVLYVNAVYEGETLNAPELSEGWVEVDDPANFPEFTQLGLQGFLDYFTEEDEEEPSSDPLDNLELILEHITDVTSEESELDGQPVEVITLVLGWNGLRTILSETGNFNEDDPMMGLFEAAFGEQDDLLQISLVVDEEDTPVAFTYSFNLNAKKLDMTTVDPSMPAGAMIDIMLDNSALEMRSQVNETFEPVEAPE